MPEPRPGSPGADRWSERKRRELEAQVTPNTRDEETLGSEPDADVMLPTRAGWQSGLVFRSSYVS